MSPRAAQYQSQITGKPAGQAYVADGVKFDGYARGSLLEAKGPGYRKFVEDGRFRGWFKGKDSLVKQARAQVRASGGHPIEWHVAEPEAVQAIRNVLEEETIVGIRVLHTPPRGG